MNDYYTHKIKNIDLVTLVQSHGVELKKAGNRHVAPCPFHTEKTGSFFVFPNNRFKCFGCGASGDAASFIMKTFSCSFSESLERLGVKKTNESFSKTEIQAFKKRQSLIKSFRDWETKYSSFLGHLIVSAYQTLFKIKTHDDLLTSTWIYKFLPGWEYRMDILCYGSDRDKYRLFRGVC